jgi:hypothetical protein
MASLDRASGVVSASVPESLSLSTAVVPSPVSSPENEHLLEELIGTYHIESTAETAVVCRHNPKSHTADGHPIGGRENESRGDRIQRCRNDG